MPQALRPQVGHGLVTAVLTHPVDATIVENRNRTLNGNNHQYEDAPVGVGYIGTLVPTQGGLTGLLNGSAIEQAGARNAAPLKRRDDGHDNTDRHSQDGAPGFA